LKNQGILLIRLIRESFIFAFQAIIVNKLRTILSLLGITIGIFAIVSVFTVVDSMKNKIQSSIESLGDNVIFVQKWPWAFGGDYPWWKYMKRPVPKPEEVDEIRRRCNTAEACAFLLSMNKNVERLGNSIDGADIICVSDDYEKVQTIEIMDGRYFTYSELVGGRNVAVIGSSISEGLFAGSDPIGNEFKVLGRKVQIVGVLKKEGESSFGNSADKQVILPINFAKNLIDMNFEGFDPVIMVKSKNNVSNEELKDELTGVMRSVRRLKPSIEDDFALNESSLLTQGFEELFKIVALAGWIIGGFSILVGGFGIANIMFVSVKERTNIIGIQKSLGAKNYFILFQFLFESIFLCLMGGVVGLFLIFSGTLLVTYGFDFEISLTQGNIIFGILLSATIGLISGFIPAYSASRLNPVDAIRSNQ
jgi:putative ABC transport system permease protein